MLVTLALIRQDEPDLTDVVGEGLTARDWIVAGVTLVAFIVAARFVRLLVERLVRRTDTEGTIASLVGRIVQNLLVIIGFAYSLTVLDVQVGPLLGALGVTGIAIAFAITAILENVFAAVILKTRRPIRVGDEITTNDVDGIVEEINFRTVVLRSYDGEKVVVPAAQVTDAVIVNHTANASRRSTVPVGVHYRTDLAHAQRTLLAAVDAVDEVHKAPAPQALVTAFGSSSIDFEVRFWHDPDIATTLRARSDVAMAIKAAFDAEAIEIPFPQRVVTMVGDDD